MKRLLLAALTLLALATSAHAQVTDHGSKIGLRGVKKIFLDAGNLRKEREKILEVLSENAKKIPGVELVDSFEDAEVVLYYRVSVGGVFAPDSTRGIGTPRGAPITSEHKYHDIVVVTGSVVARELGGTRLLLEYDSSKGLPVDRPAVQFAKAFIKAWAKANKEPAALKKPGS